MGVRLPAEYQEVEWIENTRERSFWVFDIDSIPNAYKVRLCNSTGESWTGLSFTESRTEYENRFTIERNSSSNPIFRFASYTNNLEEAILRSTVNSQVSSLCEYDNGVCKINGMTLGTLSMSGFEARTLTIGGTIGAKRQTRFYYYEDDNRHLIPCYRKSDGIKGIYDRVSGLFNAGEGDQSYFKVGPDVIDSISPLMVAWRRGLMMRKPKAYLYNYGEVGAFTGGFDIPREVWSGYSEFPTIEQDYVQFNGINGINVFLPFKSAIDLSSYKNLVMDVDIESTLSNYLAVRGHVQSQPNTSSDYELVRTPQSTTTALLGRTQIKIDVSAINQSAYIYFAVGGVTNYKWKLYRAWLE